MLDFSPDIGSRKKANPIKPVLEDVELTLSSDFLADSATNGTKLNDYPIDQILFSRFMKKKSSVKRRDRIILSMIGSNIHKRIRFAARKGSTGLFFQSLQRSELFVDQDGRFITTQQVVLYSILNDLGEHGFSTFQYGLIYRRIEFVRMLIKLFPHLIHVNGMCGANLKLNLIPKEFRIAYKDNSSSMDMVLFAMNNLETLPFSKNMDKVSLLQDYYDLFTLVLRVPPVATMSNPVTAASLLSCASPHGSSTSLTDLVEIEFKLDGDIMKTISALSDAVNANNFNNIVNSVTTLNWQLLQLIPSIHNANVKVNNYISRKAKLDPRRPHAAHRYVTSVMHDIILQYTHAISDLDLIDNVDLELEALTTLQDMIARNVFPPKSAEAYGSIHSTVFPLLHKYKKKYRCYYETLPAGESKLLSARGLYTVQSCYYVLLSQYHFDGSSASVSISGLKDVASFVSPATHLACLSQDVSHKEEIVRSASFSSVLSAGSADGTGTSSSSKGLSEKRRKGSFKSELHGAVVSDMVNWNEMLRHMYNVYYNNNPIVVDNSLSWLTTIGVHCLTELVVGHIETRCARFLTFLEVCKHVLHYHIKLGQTAQVDLFKAVMYLAEHFKNIVEGSGMYLTCEWIILHSVIDFVEVLSIDCTDTLLQRELYSFLVDFNELNIRCIRRTALDVTDRISVASVKSNLSLYSRPSQNRHYDESHQGCELNPVHVKIFEALCHMFYSINFEKDVRTQCRDVLDKASTLSDLFLCTCHIVSPKTSKLSNNGKHNQTLLGVLLADLPDVFRTIKSIIEKHEYDNATILEEIRALIDACVPVRAKVKELTDTSLSLLNNEETILSHFCMFVVIVYDQKYKAVLSI